MNRKELEAYGNLLLDYCLQDMIADMHRGGQVWADGRLICENGVFLIS